jgi:ornithine cyclodeaminase
LNQTIIDDAEVTMLTPWPSLIDAIRDAFRAGGVSPTRHAHSVPGPGREDISLLLMPAWNRDGDFGVKLAIIAPSNAEFGVPRLASSYVVFSGKTGLPRAVLDAGALTARRTAAASALASRYLSRENSKTLLIVGTGRAAGQLAEAHCSERQIEEIRFWGRNPDNAKASAEAAERATGVRSVTVPDVATGAAGADIISAATLADSPLIEADWVEPGTHIDLVGAFKPTMCEADPGTIAKADQVFVDTMEGAMDEAGDLIQAVEAGVFSFDDVTGDLYKLSASESSLRASPEEITIYKSVGVALQDLAAAQLCLRGLES